MGLKDELVVASDPQEGIAEEESLKVEAEEIPAENSEASLDAPQEPEPEAEEEPAANDVEDEEEEEELVDPQETLRETCQADSHCQAYQAELEKCNERVEGRENTEETCAQELYDFMHCVDHCVSKSLFSKLK